MVRIFFFQRAEYDGFGVKLSNMRVIKNWESTLSEEEAEEPNRKPPAKRRKRKTKAQPSKKRRVVADDSEFSITRTSFLDSIVPRLAHCCTQSPCAESASHPPPCLLPPPACDREHGSIFIVQHPEADRKIFALYCSRHFEVR